MKKQIEALRQKQEENMAKKDQLEVHDFKLLNNVLLVGSSTCMAHTSQP